MACGIKHFFRLLHIGRVLAKYDSLYFFEKLKIPKSAIFVANFITPVKKKGEKGERLASAFQELGPTFIKFGQFLSVRSDLVGDEIAADLSKLQDKLPFFPTVIAKDIIKNELGKDVEELFTSFDNEPIAAASIAQVHFAVDQEGREVAVKVLRPDIEKIFAREIEFFYWLAEIAEKKNQKLKRLKLKEVVNNFAEWVKIELDLRLEAAAASELKENSRNDSEILIPEVYWELISQRVMTLHRVKGVRIDDRDALIQAGHDVNQVLARASELFFKHVFRDGFFHADLHPGNVFVDDDGRIVVVDFGIMGRLNKQTRIYLAEIMIGFLNRDYKKVADVHFEAGYTPSHKSRELFAQACRSIGEPIFGRAQSKISIAGLLAQLFKISEDFDMETRPELLLLQKTMVLAEGIGRRLNPDSNFWEASRPHIERWIRDNIGIIARLKGGINDIKLLDKRIKNIGYIIDNADIIIDKLREDKKSWQDYGGKK